MDRARALDCTGRERHVLTMCGMRAARRGSGHTQQANLDGAVKLYLQSKGKLSAGDLTANQVMRTLAACLSAWPCSHPSPHASVTAGGVGRGLCSGRSAVSTRNERLLKRAGVDSLNALDPPLQLLASSLPAVGDR